MYFTYAYQNITRNLPGIKAHATVGNIRKI